MSFGVMAKLFSRSTSRLVTSTPAGTATWDSSSLLPALAIAPPAVARLAMVPPVASTSTLFTHRPKRLPQTFG